MQRQFLLTLAASLLPTVATHAAGTPGNYTVVPDLVYATVTDGMGQPLDLELDLYLPTSGGPHPLVVWVHGGGWESGDKDNPTAEPLANAGYAVASINYRLSQDAIWPAQLHDCKGAIRWLRANAGTYGLDANRFGVWGASAGGHLALVLAASNDESTGRVGSVSIDVEGVVGGNLGASSAVQAVAAWFPPTELLRMSQFPNVLDVDDVASPESRLLGAAIQTVPELTRTAGPLAYLGPEDPPLFLAHGSLDVVVPMDQSALVVDYARKTFDLDATFDAVPDVGHGVSNFQLANAQAFFDRVLKNVGSATVFVTTSGGSSFDEDGAPGTAPSFVITRAGSIASPLEVRLAWGGTAEIGSDVAALPQRVTIPTGSSSAVVTPVALDDALFEAAETLRLTVRHTAAHRVDVTQRFAELTLLDDDVPGAVPTISIATFDALATEASDSGSVRLTRTGSTASVLSIPLAFSGDALRGTDYFDPGTTVLFPPGSATVDVGIVPIDDDVAEPSEVVVVRVPRSNQYVVSGLGEASVGLLDDELASATPILNLSLSDPDMVESGDTGRMTVYSTDVGRGGTVGVTISGNATPNVDYVLPGAPVLPGVGLVADATLIPIPDGLPEGREEVVIELQPLAGYHLGIASRGRLVLEDDDVTLGPPPIDLDMTAMEMGRPTLVSVSGGPGLAPFVVYASQDRAYLSLPILGYPVLILPVDLLPIGTGALSLFGGADFVVPVPYDPVLVERQYHFQALVLASPIQLSNRVERTPIAR